MPNNVILYRNWKRMTQYSTWRGTTSSLLITKTIASTSRSAEHFMQHRETQKANEMVKKSHFRRLYDFSISTSYMAFPYLRILSDVANR